MVPVAYSAGIIALAMFGICPSCVSVSLAGGLLFLLLTQGVRAALAKLRWQLPLLLLICLINPLYSAMGSTLLCKVGPFRVYAESLAYGAVMGALLVSALLWFEAAASVVGQDEVMELGGTLLPSVTLAVSMVMRLVPQLVRRARDARTVAEVTVGRRHGMNEALRILGVLLAWSLEDSVERSDSMRARGWGAGVRRHVYRSHLVRRRDVQALLLLILLSVVLVNHLNPASLLCRITIQRCYRDSARQLLAGSYDFEARPTQIWAQKKPGGKPRRARALGKERCD